MKYYRLIDDNPKNWPSFTVGKIYPADYGSKDKTTVRAWANVISGQENWQEVPESEWLLQEAKERYPSGTEFRSAISKARYISTGKFCINTDNDIHINRMFDRGFVYFQGKWAEIIEPEIKIGDTVILNGKYMTCTATTKKEMEELKITKERVLSAAEKCSTAKSTLKELFPEVFEESYLDKLRVTNGGELGVYLKKAIYSGIWGDYYDEIPGENEDEKVESICKLIYETWIK